MMIDILLVPHHLKYAKQISTLSSHPQVKNALCLLCEHVT